MGVAAAALAVTAAAGALQVGGTIQQGRAAKAQTKFQQQVAQNNQIIAQQAAQDALERGTLAEQQSAQSTSAAREKFRASAAARGVQVDTGSAAQITGDIESLGQVNRMAIRSNARREAFALEQRAQDFGSQGQLLGVRRDQIAKEQTINIGSSLLNSSGTVASRWFKFKQTGALT